MPTELVDGFRIRALGSEQFLQQLDLSRFDEMDIETCGEARLADVRARVAGEGDQVQLGRGNSSRRRRARSIPFIPGKERSTMAHSGWKASASARRARAVPGDGDLVTPRADEPRDRLPRSPRDRRR